MQLLASFALLLFADRLHVHSSDPGCVAQARVQAALDERFARPGEDAEAARWELAYEARARGRDVELAITLRDGDATALRRDVIVAASDCASTPALIAAMVERYFRGIGWTTGAPLPALAHAAEVDAASKVEAEARTEAAAKAEAEARTEATAKAEAEARTEATAKAEAEARTEAAAEAQTTATAHAAPPSLVAERALRPALSLRALAGVTSYPALQPTAAAGLEARFGWLAPEAMVWLPAAMTGSLPPGGTAHLDTWSAQLWLSFAFDTRFITWRGGIVSGLAVESASTSGLDRPNHRGRAAFDLGLGVKGSYKVTSTLGVGLSAWGGRTLAEPDFFLEGPSGSIALGSPWQAGWKGALAIHVDFEFFH